MIGYHQMLLTMCGQGGHFVHFAPLLHYMALWGWDWRLRWQWFSEEVFIDSYGQINSGGADTWQC